MDTTEAEFYKEQFRELMQKFFAIRDMAQEAASAMREAEGDLMTAKRERLEAEQKGE